MIEILEQMVRGLNSSFFTTFMATFVAAATAFVLTLWYTKHQEFIKQQNILKSYFYELNFALRSLCALCNFVNATQDDNLWKSEFSKGFVGFELSGKELGFICEKSPVLYSMICQTKLEFNKSRSVINSPFSKDDMLIGILTVCTCIVCITQKIDEYMTKYYQHPSLIDDVVSQNFEKTDLACKQAGVTNMTDAIKKEWLNIKI